MNQETFKAMHRVTIMDMKRNFVFITTLFLSFAVYFCMVILGDGTTEKSRFIAYGVFLYITTLAMPLMYYIRYSDKDKKIITCVVKTKLTNVKLYCYLINLYQVAVFTLSFGILTLLTERKYPQNGLNICLFFSVIVVLCITNGLCLLCLRIFKRYYIGLIVYVGLCIFFLMSSSIWTSFFCPINYEIWGLQYFAGKLAELFFVSVGNGILSKKFI